MSGSNVPSLASVSAADGVYCFSFQMMNEELEQCGGEVLLRRLEPLKVAADLQKNWVDLGIAVHSRHKDLSGKMPPELKVLMKINKNCNQLCQQYRIRLSGENGEKWFCLP